jgi:hypothetical protein
LPSLAADPATALPYQKRGEAPDSKNQRIVRNVTMSNPICEIDRLGIAGHDP